MAKLNSRETGRHFAGKSLTALRRSLGELPVRLARRGQS